MNIPSDLQAKIEQALRNENLGQNDRLVAELLGFMPIPERFVSEWIPSEKLIEGVKNPYMPKKNKVKLLARLAKYSALPYRLFVAIYPETPIHILKFLAGDIESVVRIVVKLHDNAPTEIIDEIENQHQIALSWQTSPEILSKLGNSKWAWIRETVAKNPRTSSQTLAELAHDEFYLIRLKVAKNKNTPTSTLDLLLKDNDEDIEKSIAKSGALRAIVINPNTSENALFKLLPDYHQEISNRKNLSSRILEGLYHYNNDEEKSDRYTAKLIRHPNTPSYILERLTHCESSLLEELVQHPNVSIKTLEKLTRRKNISLLLLIYESHKISESLRAKLRDILLKQDCYTVCDIAISSKTPISIRYNLLQQLINYTEEDLLSLVSPQNDFYTTSSELSLKISSLLDDDEFEDEDEEDDDEYEEIKEEDDELGKKKKEKEIKEKKANKVSQDILLKIANSDNTPNFVLSQIVDRIPKTKLQINLRKASNFDSSEIQEEDFHPVIVSQCKEIYKILAQDSRTLPEVLEIIAQTISAYESIDLYRENQDLCILNYHQIYLLNIAPLETIVPFANRLASKGYWKYKNYEQSCQSSLHKKLCVDLRKILWMKQNNQFKLKKEDKFLYLCKAISNNFRFDELASIYTDLKEEDIISLLEQYIQSNIPFIRLISLLHPLLPTKYLTSNYTYKSWLQNYLSKANCSTTETEDQYICSPDKNQQLLATLDVLIKPLQTVFPDWGITYDGYQIFHWETSVKGKFTIDKLMAEFSTMERKNIEKTIDSWQKLEENNYHKIKEEAKVFRHKQYHDLLKLLEQNCQSLNVDRIKLNSELKYGYEPDNFCGILVGKVTNKFWIAIMPSFFTRHDFPEWIISKPLRFNKFKKTIDLDNTYSLPNNSQTLKLQLEINNILQNLPTLKLYYDPGDGYCDPYNYRLFPSFATSKKLAIQQCLYNANILRIRQYQAFKNVDSHPYGMSKMGQFFSQNLRQIKVYDFAYYNNTHTYIIGKTNNDDRLGISIVRGYTYNP